MGTALLGPLPDNTCKAVFAVVTADGAIVQEHTLKGLDGAAPAGTIEPLLTWNWDEQEDGVEPRFGVLMNPYTPATGPIRQLFVRAVQQLHCDRQHRRRGHRLEPGLRTWSRQSHQHALAANPGRSCGRAEGRNNPNWESNTTLGNGSGIYAANRGNNTIVRMHQDGSIVAVRRVALDDVPLDDASLNGIGPR